MTATAHRNLGIGSVALLVVLLVGFWAARAWSAPLPDPIGRCIPAATLGCPDGQLDPGIHGVVGNDAAVNVFVGGDFRVRGGAAESEGRLVVLGDLDVARDFAGTYNIGVVGAGSGVAPPVGADHAIIGGNLSVASRDTVGIGGANPAQWGNLAYGGTSSGAVDFSGPGGQRRDLAATDPYAELPDVIEEISACALTNVATGTVERGEAFNTIFRGDGSSTVQVFDVQETLPVDGGAVDFVGIPPGASIIINVRGSNVDLNIGNVNAPIRGITIRDGLRLLWNIADANVARVRGYAQLPGTILVPSRTGSTTITVPGTTGRILVNGDLEHGGSGQGGGQELHNYPFTGDVPCVHPTPTPTPTETTSTPTPTETTPEPTPTETTPTETTPTETTPSETTPTVTTPPPSVSTQTESTPASTPRSTAPTPGSSTTGSSTTGSSTTGSSNTSATSSADSSDRLSSTGATSAMTAVGVAGTLLLASGLLTLRRRSRGHRPGRHRD